jgi:DNA-directed RNA polymerase specialized sigma24 family protein
MMDDAEIRRIVRLTIQELKQKKLLFDDEQRAYKTISQRLQRFYSPIGYADDDLKSALDELKQDRYRPVLWMFYSEGLSNEAIAEPLGVDVRTVTRNKKRLCLELYMRLYF